MHRSDTISFADVTQESHSAQVATCRERCRSAPRRSARSACSCCCAGSRRARSRSPVSRRSRTACPRSRRPSRERGDHARSGWASSSARCSSACRCWRTTCSRSRSRRARRSSRRWAAPSSGKGFMYYVLQVATAAILTLAANTAYADFPRLSSIIARDGYLPRQLANRGDRLVFSNGVLVLAVAASDARRDLRRQRVEAHPALRGRRVHVVHAVADGHGAPSPEGARTGLAAQHRRSTPSARSRR